MPKLPLKEELKTVERQVAYILREFPETRGSDRELIRVYWELQGFRIPKKLLGAWYQLTHPKTITRARRKIQAQGLFKADSLKTAQRSLRGMEFRQLFGGKNG